MLSANFTRIPELFRSLYRSGLGHKRRFGCLLRDCFNQIAGQFDRLRVQLTARLRNWIGLIGGQRLDCWFQLGGGNSFRNGLCLSLWLWLLRCLCLPFWKRSSDSWFLLCPRLGSRF